MKNTRGFTLTELMIVIAVTGILAAIATPIYTNVTNKARAREFMGVLSELQIRQRQYFRENREFLSISKGDFSSTAAQKLGLTAETHFFDYEVTTTSDGYTATATLKENLGRAKQGAQGTGNS
ncbi:type IV pilin protein [Chitinivibrio alkaliphilus]|uniref:Type IV pilus biogenesis protein PilE n=1 Tax=Chitinivibrio alkaliphilus ACht1 TaxID=1313304 RepID=U7D9X2_9BACT|nr:prepilin-type N-terminal cleavage/methylation domain-containing protein [Chitinivibrio alkaliphilus]ERP31892.1 type IV pilus biogenesis protein PilE [Chitinivibrio alkaliphilus ACht1]